MDNIKENKMGTTPILKLLITMALPMVISMFIQSLYNVVDSFYVGQYSDNALTAIGLAWPMQNLIIAFATGIGVGINAILSKSLGQRDNFKASKTAFNGCYIMVVIYILFLIVGLTLVPTFMNSISNDNAVISEGIIYLKWILIGSFGVIFAITFERILQSTGRTFPVMIAQGIGAILNIILDPIFINGFWFIPSCGIKGAAIATLIGQWFSMIIAIILNLKLNKDLKISKDALKLDFKLIKEILVIGIPSSLMGGISSVLTFLFNKILLVFTNVIIPGTSMYYGKLPQTIFGLYFRLNSIFFMPIFGLNNAVVPIVAYQLGAKNKEKMMQTYKYALLFVSAMMLVGTCLFLFIPSQLLSIFSSEDSFKELYSLVGVPCLRIIASSFMIAAICIVNMSMFQALGKGVTASIISFVRQIIVLLPSAYLLSLTKNLNLVWLSFLIAEIVAFIISLFLFKKMYNDKIKVLN